MPNQLEKKYVNSAKEPGWQFFFPALELTYIIAEDAWRR